MRVVSFSSILVTTDLSLEATKAYPFARSIADRYSGKITLLACVDTSAQYAQAGTATMEGPLMYTPQQTAEMVEALDRQLKEQTLTHFSELSVTARALESAAPVGHSIVSFAIQQECDLIVMSSHGRTGLKRALMGSVAEYVMRHSMCPVLIVPARSPASS